MDLRPGDVVNVPGGMFGTVRFVGPVAAKPGRFVGVELAAEHAHRGKNSGDVDGRRYFTTAASGAGIFVPANSKMLTRRAGGSSSGSGSSTSPPRSGSATTPGSARSTPTATATTSITAPTTATTTPRSTPPTSPPSRTTPARPPAGVSAFSRSIGPGATPAGKAAAASRPSISRPESPLKATPRTPGLTRINARPRVSTAATTAFRPSDPDPPSVSSAPPLPHDDTIRSLEAQLRARDAQLQEQAATLTELTQAVTELEGVDVLTLRAQLREKNEKISSLTADFDTHRADFRSTLDTLEIAAAETERVYEKRVDELVRANRELHERGADVDTVARQLKQLEELVSELEEGLEDARRGEAEARADVEFARGELERCRLELDRERERARGELDAAHAQAAHADQKDDEIRGLKAIIQTLSRDPNAHIDSAAAAAGATADSRLADLTQLAEFRARRIDELERELERVNRRSAGLSSSATPSATPSRARQPRRSNPPSPVHAHSLSDRTVVPHDFGADVPSMPERPAGDINSNSNNTTNNNTHHNKDDDDGDNELPEPEPPGLRVPRRGDDDSRSAAGSSASSSTPLWCEICETAGHDILTCTNMFGPNTTAGVRPPPAAVPPPVPLAPTPIAPLSGVLRAGSVDSSTLSSSGGGSGGIPIPRPAPGHSSPTTTSRASGAATPRSSARRSTVASSPPDYPPPPAQLPGNPPTGPPSSVAAVAAGVAGITAFSPSVYRSHSPNRPPSRPGENGVRGSSTPRPPSHPRGPTQYPSGQSLKQAAAAGSQSLRSSPPADPAMNGLANGRGYTNGMSNGIGSVLSNSIVAPPSAPPNSPPAPPPTGPAPAGPSSSGLAPPFPLSSGTGTGSASGGLPAAAGKTSGVVDESRWCALCERDGHESIDCPFDE